MKRGRILAIRSVILGVSMAVLLGGCIPFFGDDENDGVSPTPTPTITIIRPSPTAVAEPTAPPAEEAIYVVQSGDVLSTIADKYPGVTWQDIAKANNLQDPYPLSVGQKLIIPPPPAQEPTPTPAGPTVVQTPVPKN